MTLDKASYAREWWEAEMYDAAERRRGADQDHLAEAAAACADLRLLERLWGGSIDDYMYDFESFFGASLTRRAARMHLRKCLRESAG